MGKGIKAGNKPTGEKVTISTSEFRKIIRDTTEQVAKQSMDDMLLIVISYLMEEEEFKYDIDRITNFVVDVNRYFEAINDETLDFKMSDIAKIVSEKTGTQIRWIR